MVRDTGFEPVGAPLIINDLRKGCHTGCHTNESQAGEFPEGFEICEVINAWLTLPKPLRAAVLAIVRSHKEDLSINRPEAEVAAARAPKGNSSRAGAKPEQPVCGQVAVTPLTVGKVAQAKTKKTQPRKEPTK
ncbi:hypothetical protein TSACC_3323 [Terrimicrobium sacchariphilum]|uniref:Uncharacterized protein n=1 Tax=Terrimicrobium sacchariphilum TaxID=690879 RepID=A0A146GCD6_TERSA|nr:hypothetical protein TSACC_3323 [Terrimicrobium sacchariphilum]